MDASMLLYWQLYFENYSTDYLIQESNILRDYKNDLIEGPVIDLGCGQSESLLCFLNTGRKIYAVDNEQLQLDYLKRRVLEKAGNDINNWNFLNLSIGTDEMPREKYALIICTNLLHFFTLPQCKSIVRSWMPNMATGTLVYIKVHSGKHPSNDLSNPERNSYFRHYFSEEDIDDIFPDNEFEKIYCSETKRKETAKEKNFLHLWLDTWFERNQETNREVINKVKSRYLDTYQANLTVILKKT